MASMKLLSCLELQLAPISRYDIHHSIHYLFRAGPSDIHADSVGSNLVNQTRLCLTW